LPYSEPHADCDGSLREGVEERELVCRQRLRPVLRPLGRADQPAIAVVDPLDGAAALEGRGTAVAHDDGVTFFPVAGTVRRAEFGDDAAAVAIEDALLARLPSGR